MWAFHQNYTEIFKKKQHKNFVFGKYSPIQGHWSTCMTLLYVSNYLLVYFISVLFIHSFIYIYPYFLSLFIFLFVCVINWNKALIVELFESMSTRLFNGLYFHFSIRWSIRSSARLSVINFCQNWLISTFLKKYFYIELTSPKWSKLKERNSLNKFYFSCLSPKDYPKSYFLDSLKKVNFMFI